MARPVQKRTAKSYARDIEALSRLRTALMLDTKADFALVQRAVTKIDETISALRPLVEELTITERG